ncbi:hypothetical protein NKR23_g6935 [Pleurostoma richardsiae]|uniref:Uncharacterized protein n=1 Tax=Pleurostoma richardsiae TaxID=41990 RepID=A0AA38VNL5_9PEZI|nr:hypothetical protein NKR23_g6935 [Pleurostoma richardsiae]
MFSTKTLSSLKGMLPPIHQPLPLNQREAQQLLNTLTASFRKNLDREHGWLNDERPTANNDSSEAGTLHPYLRDPYRRPTDRHLRAILSNPLFSYDRSAQQPSPGRSSERDPMDVFNEAVAKGLMTPRGAAGCLLAKRREIVQSPTLSIRQTMAASSAGLRVVQWLRASGLERDLSFITYPMLTVPLLKFMVIEGLDEIAWGWLERLLQGEGPQSMVMHQSPASLVLDSLVRAKSDGASSLNDAYAFILRGEDMFGSTSAFGANFLTTWRHLSWLSTVHAWRRASPSKTLFESFVSVGERLRKPLQIDRAHLDLHHPTRPSHTLAVKFLQNEAMWQRFLHKASPASSARNDGQVANPSAFALRLTSMGLDTVQYLTRNGQSEEAQWVLDLLRTNFSSYFSRYPPNFTEAVTSS